MEYLTVPFSLIVDETDAFASMGELPENSFRGMASVFNGLIDGWVPTTIHPGAFTKTLQEKGRGVKILWQHDASEPIGIPETMIETNTGLAVQGKISQTSRGKDALQLMRDRVVDALSIGFDPIKEELEFTPKGDIQMRHIREVRLWEFSLVTWGADPNAKISEIHSKLEFFGTTPFGNLPLYERDAEWSSSAADKRVREWANVTEKPNAKYRRAFVWYDGQNADKFEGYKLQIADITDETLKAVPRAIFAVAAVLQGARGGVDIPEPDKERARKHIEKYYEKMRAEFNDETIIPPWDENSLAALGSHRTEDALFLLGQKLVEGLGIEEAKAAFSLIGVVPETPHTPVSVDVGISLADAELAFAKMAVESL